MPKKLIVTKPADFVEFDRTEIFQGIHQRIEKQVKLYSEHPALKTPEVEYTYHDMNGHANCVAEAILAVCGKSMAQAVLLLPNTPELIVAMLGCLKAHKAYVPLDRNFPIERLRMMFADANPAVVLTDGDHYGQAEVLAQGGVPVINISKIQRYPNAPNVDVACDPLDRAYILYTSGSTGRPKGIVFLHRNLLHTKMCFTNQLFFSPSDRITWLHSPSFGSSVVDIYASLMNGATMYPWDSKVQGFDGLAQWLKDQKVTTFQWIPSAFRQFLRTVPDGFQFRDIRIVVLAGEPLTIREVDLFRKYFARGSHLVNQVGTGESYNYHLYPIDHDIPIEDANVAGGYPVSSEREVLLLDDSYNCVPQGDVGEIAIKSHFMSDGYWQDEALTQAKFIRIGNDDTPVYLTGDLGRSEPDGCLIHLGRKDFQFKVRGIRIEPAEIEHALTRAPGVADCACWVAKNRLGEDQLVGYVVPRTAGEFDQHAVEAELETTLPKYMVPRTYVLLDSLPALPNGKADRKSLPNPFVQADTKIGPIGSPLSSVEEELLNIFRDMLQLDDVTAETDFLTAGGDSLAAVVLRVRIQQSFGIEIPMESFQKTLTPARLSALIASRSNSAKHVSSRKRAWESSLGSVRSQDPVSNELLPGCKSVVEVGTGRPEASSSNGIVIKNLVILGAGQCGREFYIWASQAIAAGASLRIKGFLDDAPDALRGREYKAGILGRVSSYEIAENDVFVSAIGNPTIKAKLCSRILERGGLFINIIHPLANVGMNVDLGKDVVFGPFSSVTCDTKIGSHVSVGALSNVAHDCTVGDYCQISSHCGVNGNASLAEGVFLGSHACILPSVKVGAWSFVGAGSVVVRNVPERTKVFGNPASVIGTMQGS